MPLETDTIKDAEKTDFEKTLEIIDPVWADIIRHPVKNRSVKGYK